MSYFTSKYYILGLAYAIFENHCTLINMSGMKKNFTCAGGGGGLQPRTLCGRAGGRGRSGGERGEAFGSSSLSLQVVVGIFQTEMLHD